MPGDQNLLPHPVWHLCHTISYDLGKVSASNALTERLQLAERLQLRYDNSPYKWLQTCFGQYIKQKEGALVMSLCQLSQLPTETFTQNIPLEIQVCHQTQLSLLQKCQQWEQMSQASKADGRYSHVDN